VVTEYIPRRAARILLLDAQARVLLFHGWDPARPEHTYWMTPGGGLDGGESPAQGAARELFEETGLRVSAAELGEPVWREITQFPFDGVWYRQEQEFFLYRVAEWAVDTAGFDAIERGSIDTHRWWSAQELASTTERYYPRELISLLDDLVGA
jgi:8-oxo-dGTP pyrophosphatase MutT (NUDIX family)